MTNEELLDKIKSEIERRKKSLRAGFCSDAFTKKQKNEMLVASEELDRFNRFLSDLEKSEKPVPKNLEEAAEKHASSVEGDYAFSEGPDHYCSGDLEEAFIAGANWQAEQLLKSSPLPEDTVLFNKGVAEGKRLMMEEAVEGRVISNDGISFPVSNEIHRLKLMEGDKVKIIIVKED